MAYLEAKVASVTQKRDASARNAQQLLLEAQEVLGLAEEPTTVLRA